MNPGILEIEEEIGKHSVNPFVECTPTNHQSSSSYVCSSDPELPFPVAVAASTAYSLQPTASIRSVDRIDTVTAIAHGTEERIGVVNTEAAHGIKETISFAAKGDFENRFLAITTQIEVAKQASQEKLGGENSYLWDRIVTKLEQSRDSWNKVNELLGQGKEEKALLWKRVAEDSEAAAERIRQVVLAYISGEKEILEQSEKGAWNVYYLSDASTWSLKSAEVLEKVEKANQMQSEEKELWKNLANQYKIAADYERKALEAHIVDKEAQRNSCSWAGRYMHSSAERQLKALEAQAAGSVILAVGYQGASETSQKAVGCEKQAITAHILGKEDEGYCWAWVAHSLQKKADYQAKACEAEDADKTILAVGYREAAVISELASDQWKLSAKAKIAGKISEGNSWGWVGDSLQLKADYQAKEFEAEEVKKIILASGYRAAAATIQCAADKWKLSAQKKAVGKESEGVSWGNEGKSLQLKAEYQVKATEAEEDGEETLAVGYRELAVILEHVAGLRKLATKSYAAWKKDEADSWDAAARSLKLQADYQEKVIKAQQVGREDVEAGYREIAEIFERVAECYKQAAEVFTIGKSNEGAGWLNAARFLQSKADDQVKTVEKTEKTESSKSINLQKNRVLSNLPSVKTMALFVCCEKWLAETSLPTKLIHIRNNYIINAIKKGAEHKLIKIFEKYWDYVAKVHELGDDSLALAWIQVAEDIQQALGDSIKSAEANRKQKLPLSNAWKNSAEAMQKVAEYRDRYIQTSLDSSIPEVVSLRKKVVEGSQFVADYYRKSAEACSLYNHQEFNHFNKVADSMKKHVSDLEEAVTGLEKSLVIVSKPEISERWRKAIEQYQIAVEFAIKATEEGAESKESPN